MKRKVKSSRRTKFEEDAGPHLDSLWRSALWLTMRRSLAEDLVLKTIAGIYCSRSSASDTIGTKLRLFRFLTREFFDGNGRRPQARGFLDENGKATRHGSNSDLRYLGKSVGSRELEMLSGISGMFVRGAIARLRPHSRLIMMLFHLEGFSSEEIAYITDLRKDSVRSILVRLRRLLPRYLIHHIDGFPSAVNSRTVSPLQSISSGREIKSIPQELPGTATDGTSAESAVNIRDNEGGALNNQ